MSLTLRAENSEIYRALVRNGVRFVNNALIREVAGQIRRHGPGYLKTAARQVANKVAYRSGNTVSRFQQNLGTVERQAPATVERPKKKSRIDTDTRPIPMAQPTGFAQRVDYYKKKNGKYISKRQKVMSTLEAHVQPIVERWQANSDLISEDTATAKRGALQLLAGPLNATDWVWPVYLFDMTGVKNTNMALAQQYPQVAYGLRQTSATNNFYYNLVNNTGSDNVANLSTWGVEQLARNTASLANVPLAGMSAMLDSFKVKMSAYGCSKQPTEVYLEMWRFTDEKLVPDMIVTANGAAADPQIVTNTTSDQDRLNSFWQYMLTKMIGTRDNDQISSIAGKGVDIKRLWTFKFGPTSSDNEGVGNTIKNLTYDHQFNRYLKLDWNADNDVDLAEVNIGNPDHYATMSNSTAVHSHPNQCSRIFLVVRADVQQTFKTAWGTLTVPQQNVVLDEFQPQFDLQIRRFRQMVHT